MCGKLNILTPVLFLSLAQFSFWCSVAFGLLLLFCLDSLPVALWKCFPLVCDFLRCWSVLIVYTGVLSSCECMRLNGTNTKRQKGLDSGVEHPRGEQEAREQNNALSFNKRPCYEEKSHQKPKESCQETGKQEKEQHRGSTTSMSN